MANPRQMLRGIYCYETERQAKLAAERLQQLVRYANFSIAPHPADPTLFAVQRSYEGSVWWCGYMKDFPVEGDYR